MLGVRAAGEWRPGPAFSAARAPLSPSKASKSARPWVSRPLPAPLWVCYFEGMARGLVAGSDDYNRGFRRIVFSLISLVIVPTALLLAVGIVMLVFYDLRANLLFGLLVVVLVFCLIAGAVLALVFLRQEANLSRLQLDF